MSYENKREYVYTCGHAMKVNQLRLKQQKIIGRPHEYVYGILLTARLL